jgi:hypothetical protein
VACSARSSWSQPPRRCAARDYELIDLKWTHVPVIPAEAGIQAMFELKPHRTWMQVRDPIRDKLSPA